MNDKYYNYMLKTVEMLMKRNDIKLLVFERDGNKFSIKTDVYESGFKDNIKDAFIRLFVQFYERRGKNGVSVSANTKR